MATFRTRTGKDGRTSVHTMVRLSGYPTRTATLPSMRDAKRWAATIEAEMVEGRHFKDAAGRKRTLAEAIDRYLDEVLPQKRDGSMYRFTLAWWKTNHGPKVLGEVSRGWLAERRTELLTGTFTRATPGSRRSLYKAVEASLTPQGQATLRKHGADMSAPVFARSPATANRYMAALSHVFTLCCGDWEWLQAGNNPFTGLSKLREGTGRTRHLSADERARLLAETAKDPQLHVLVCLALATAARAGELVGLTWAHVEFIDALPSEPAHASHARLLFIDTKNGSDRIAWVFGDALELLLAHDGGAVHTPGSPVFPGRWSHKHKRYAGKKATHRETTHQAR